MAYTVIDNPGEYFSTKLYTGNASTSHAISGVGFAPDWVWLKNRGSTDGHHIYDSVRGGTKRIRPDTTATESTQSNGLTVFGTDGFTVSNSSGVNSNGANHVAWNWKAGTSFTNDASSTSVGDIDSSGSVSTTAGFSIITATSDGAANKDIAHGLGAVPDVIFAKNLARTYNWDCYFKTLGYDASLILNENNATRTGAWGSNTFTTTTFETQDDFSSKGSEAYIYYCFAEKKGFSKFGSYTGNGNNDGTFIYTGFKPSIIICKKTSSTGNWELYDNKRNGFNGGNVRIIPDSNDAESGTGRLSLVSNGFKITTSSGNLNGSGDSFIYMAFAEAPLVTSTGVPATAR